MNRLTAALIFILFNFQIYAQDPKDVNYSEKVFSADFNSGTSAAWPAKDNSMYGLGVSGGAYQLSVTSQGRQAFVIPQDMPVIPEYMLKCALQFDKDAPGNGSFGIALDMQPGLSRGYLLEVNAQRQFRVSVVEGRGKYRYLTANARQQGWREFSKIGKAGKRTDIGVLKQKNRIKIYLNDKLAYTFLAPDTLNGAAGLYLLGTVKAKVNSFDIYGPPGSRLKALISKAVGDNLSGEDDGILSGDVNTLTNAVIECRTRNREIVEMYSGAQIHLLLCTEKMEELEDFIKNHLDVKLQAENEKLLKQAQQLRLENNSLQQENAGLQDLKRQAEKGKDGDLVILLSEKLKKEQQHAADLEERLKQLEEENRKLKENRKR